MDVSPLRLLPSPPAPLHPGLIERAQPGRSIRVYLSPVSYVKVIPYSDPDTVELAIIVGDVQLAVLEAGPDVC